uniref:Uncharacterized protein n=1 Tax=Knipowitschia caucasica TaxID=637954 RepID=A0AAV2L4X0_KNICA
MEFEKVKDLPCGETHDFTVKFDPKEAKLPLGSVCVVLPIQIKAVQLFNHECVPCQWSMAEEVKLKKVNKFLPFSKQKQQRPPVVFEMVPSSGVLSPGERVNVLVKFTPLEEILRLMQGYDENNKLLLPPRIPGEGLPQELLDFYQHHASDFTNNGILGKYNYTECDKQMLQTGNIGYKKASTALEKAEILLSEINKGLHKELGQLQLDPVSRAITRHMGLDLSPESLAALNRRGIAIIVYGAPKTDIGSTAVSLAQYYGAMLLKAQQQDMAKHEKLWLQELDEDEYDALPEEKKHIIEQHRLRLAKDQIRIRISKEQEQQRQLEDSKRHVEEQKKNYKKGLKKDPSKKEPNEIANQLMSRQNSKETLGENKLVKTFKDGPNNYANHDQTEETKESPINAEKLDIYKLSVDELQTEFIAFEQSQVQVEHILQHWDRVQGVLLVPFPVDDLPGDEEGMPEKITPVGKGKGKKANYKVSKYSQIENTEEKLCPTDVIPHIVVNAMEKDCTVFPKPLPSLEEELKLWAYPTKVGQIKDSIVCHIKDNNEPVVIDVSCWGVRPELELDTKSLPFDKTIIHRRVSRTLNMHNKTAVHVSWRLQGIDDLGDSFIVPQDQGIVPPYSTFPLTLHFRAKKPLHTKKTVRLEVSDVEKILGIVHTENITVSAEAYDVSINIEPDSLDFGTMKVFSDAKTTLKIQNHGKYEIAYRLLNLILEKEVKLLYRITPTCDINFGPLIFGGKKTKPFIIENTGVFETRFSISCMIAQSPERGKKPPLDLTNRHNAVGGKVKPEYMQKDMCIAQTRLTAGVFSVYPCTAVVLPGSQQVVTVECSGDELGSFDQGLIIDICDRDPSDHPDGIPYKLLAEVYKTAQLQIDMPDKDGVFTLNAAPGNDCCSISTVILESSADAEPQSAYRTLAHLNVKEKVEFEVSFCSTKDQKCHTNVYIKDCQYIDLIISVTGEASKEIVSLENITRPLLETDQIAKNGTYEMDFGDCHVNATYQESFTMVNHSRDKGLRFEWALPAPQVRFSPQEGYVHPGCSVEVVVSFCSSQPITLTSKPMKCKLTQVVFKEPLELCDDQQKTPLLCATPSPLPANKVIKLAPDPSYSVVDGWHLDLELRVSAVCDFAKFSFSNGIVKFEDTMLYQTSLQSLLISNEGNVGLAFSWTVDYAHIADETVTNGSSSGSSNAETRPSSTTASVSPSLKAPLNAVYKTCRKRISLPLSQCCGRSMMPNYHFDLEDSDYIRGGRRNFESKIPIDSQTRVVEFIAVGLAKKSTRSFFVLNPTNISYSFKWRCEDTSESSFQCLTPSGILQPKEKAEIRLAFVSEQMDIVESLWSFVIDALSVSVPFLFVGITRAPRVYLEKALINFKSLLVENEAEETVHLFNGEDESFDFSVLQQSLVCDDKLSSLAVQPMSGFLRPELRPNHVDSLEFQKVGISEQSSFLFLICNLQDVRLSIKVKNGASFTIDVKGQGTAPSLNFSFTKHNFGKCLVRSPGMFSHSPSITLVITNKGKRKVSIQCLFENTSYLHVEIGFQSSILASVADLKIPITFCPQEECCYKEKLDFVLNSGITRQVDILGQGIELKLEVQDPKHKVIDFRSLTLGKKVKKAVVLVNRSSVNLSFSLHLNSDPPLNPQDLFVTPIGQLSLKAGKSCVVEVHFHPRQHVFTVEMQAETRGLLHPLLSIRGSCQGVEVHLDQNNLAFGPLVQNCKTSKKIAMMNTGEISAKFLQLCDDCRFENLPCIVEGRSSPLTLTVTGSCVMASDKEVVNFICPVRSSHTQKLSVLNPTNQSCTVKPVIEGEQWRGAPVIVLEPLQNMMFEITYCPLTMTTDRKKHLGSVFFSFVDGTGLLYSLQGTAEAPKTGDTIVLELPAKTHHTELLPVHNWLLKQQQFCVRLEFLKPDKPDATVSLSGLDVIDVPALTKKDYKLSFHAYKTGQYKIKVTFHNEESGEYLFYLITFKITSSVHVQSTIELVVTFHNEESGEYLFYLIIFKITSSVHVQSTIELVTTVRQPVSATVHTENPLPTNVCLTTECKCADISVPLHHTVPGHSKDSLTFEYLPLHVVTSVTVKFTNFSRTRTEYSCKTDYPDFLVDKKVTAAAGLQSGSETSVDVCFEPHQLGEVKTQLTLHSPAGGEYIFPLHGVCDDPKPQGPFYIAAGQIVHIPFKNVFLQNTIFTYKVNNPSFTVKGPETIRSKSTEKVLVSFGSPPEGGSGSWFGRLTISSEPSDVHTKSCSWTFYLNGFRPVTP